MNQLCDMSQGRTTDGVGRWPIFSVANLKGRGCTMPVADVALRDADRDLNYTIFIILAILKKEALENK